MKTTGICIRKALEMGQAADLLPETLRGADFEQYADSENGSLVTIYEVPENLLRSASQMERWSTISRSGSSRYRDAAFIFGLWFNVPDVALDRFDRWYEEEHTSMLLECPEWKAVRRFASIAGAAGANRLVLHHLDTSRALDSAARQNARATRAARWFLDQEWFRGSTKQLLKRFTA